MLTNILSFFRDNDKLLLHSLLYTTTITLSALVISRYFKSRSWSKLKASPFYKPMEGKVCIITGANSGIGYETAKELAKLKATVVLGCRSMIRGQEALEKLKKEVQDGQIVLMELNLASFDSIKNFAKNVMKQYPKIHVLINNAGVSVPIKEKLTTKEGYEVHFGINHVGHFLLTNLLIERIQKSSTDMEQTKVVIVGSSLMDRGTIDFDNLNGEKGFVQKGHSNPAYCNSKLMNYYFGAELYLKYADKGVDVSVVCPGWCYTNLFRHADIKFYQKVMIFPIAMMYMRSANQGAQSVVHCAISPNQTKHFPPIFRDFAPYIPKHEYNDEVSKKLWDVTAKLTSIQ
ncbi:retinol dehydrogenase 12-like isoform X5 [Diaphorina citri]|uniref:Retinol dehydrogenase 12-like isoform X5 n=1 Tax=Diaphorina citri TaxID=121845 RepID=A0A1S4EIP8_DIACI|nr:retinol dehydrogenase 12-like isoform X5 [Diaphorina citri]